MPESLAMPVLTLINRTTLTIVCHDSSDASSVRRLAPGQTVALPATVRQLILRDAKSGMLLRAQPLDLGSATLPLSIEPFLVPGSSTGAVQATAFTNGSSARFVRLFTMNDGKETRLGAPLAPGDTETVAVAAGTVVMCRSVVGGALGGMLVVPTSPAALLTLTLGASVSDDTDEIGQQADNANTRLPQPIPGFEKLVVEAMGAHGSPHKQSDFRYVHVATAVEGQASSDAHEVYNGVVYEQLRSLTITGVELIFSSADPQRLMGYAGDEVRDVKAVTIIGDRVTIGTKLRFPGAQVTVNARVLEIKDAGCLSTEGVAAKLKTAMSAKHSPDGALQSADGTTLDHGADGLPGQPGGAITLNVKELVLPDDGAARFIARGTSGQKGEAPSAWKPYLGASGRASTAVGKHLAPVTADDLAAVTGFYAQFAERLVWPGGMASSAGVTYKDIGVFPSSTAHDAEGAPAGAVCYARVELDHMEGGYGQWPQEEHRVSWVSQQEGDSQGGKSYRTVVTRGVSQPDILLPGDGEDAVAGGAPGAGGGGGTLLSTVSIRQSAYDLAAGAPGETTPALDGRPPGRPHLKNADGSWVTYRVEVVVTGSNVSNSPTLLVHEEPLKAGRNALEKTCSANGTVGVFKEIGGTDVRFSRTEPTHQSLPVGSTSAWLDSILLSLVTNYAADAFRLGDRLAARRSLEPYLAELSAQPDMTAMLVGTPAQWQRVHSLGERLLSNLDYYGNPPGWVPRLDALSSFTLMQDLRRLSLQLRDFAGRSLATFDAIRLRIQDLHAGIATMQSHFDAARADLDTQVGRLLEARAALLDAQETAKSWSGELQKVTDLITAEAIDEVHRSNAIRAVMKIAAAGLRVLPIGQPYVGLAGAGLSAIGDVDFAKADTSADWSAALTKLGGSVDTFMSKNMELMTTDLSASTRSKLEGTIKFTTAERNKLDEKLESQRDAATAASNQCEKIQSAGEASDSLHAAQATVDQLSERLDELNTLLTIAGDPGGSDDGRWRRRTEREHEQVVAALGRAKVDLASATAAAATAKATEAALTEGERTAARKATADKLDEAKKDQQIQMDQLGKITKENLSRMAGVGQGVSDLGQAIGLMKTVTAEDPDVKATITELKKSSEFSKRYDLLQDALKDAAAKVQPAASMLDALQSKVGTRVSFIATSLDQLTTMVSTIGALDHSQDPQLRQYLVDMENGAADFVRESVYDFVLALRYELVRDLPVDLLDVDDIVDAMAAACVAKDGDTPDSASIWKLDAKTYASIENSVLLNALSQIVTQQSLRLAHKISRQSRKGIPRLLTMTATTGSSDQRILSELNSVRISRAWCVQDLEIVGTESTYLGARLAGAAVTSVAFASTPPEGSHCTIRIRHSGRSLIVDNTNGLRAYYFQAAPDDDPIEWVFTWAQGASAAKFTITPDAADQRSSQLISRMLSGLDATSPTAPLDATNYVAYQPGLYAAVDIILEPSPDVPAIISLGLSFDITHLGELT